MAEGRGRHLVAGLVVLHLLCCGLPLLIAAGVLGGTGALTSSPALLAAGAAVLVAAGAVAVTRLRPSRSATTEACCPPAQQTYPPTVSRASSTEGSDR